MKLRLWNLALGLAFTLFVAAGMIWVRSFVNFDEFGWEVHDRIVAVGWSHGRLFMGLGTDYPSSAKRGWNVGKPSPIHFEHELAGFGYRNKLITKTYRVRALAFPIWLPMILLAAPAVIFARHLIRSDGRTRVGFEINQASLFSDRPST